MNKEIAEVKKILKHAQDCYLHVVKKVQSECKHKHCVISESTLETWTVGCGYGTGKRPFKVCKDCGYAWYGPGVISQSKLTQVSVEEADNYRIGPIHERS